jgi:hypothetical protein
MGLLDRLRGRREDDGDDEVPPEPPLDVDARRAQLDDLERALRTISRAMAAETARMTNPGWRGRVEDLRFAANEAGRLSNEGFTRAELLDLANQVRPLYAPSLDQPPQEYLPYADQQAVLLAAVAALRTPLPSEQA